MSRVNFAVENFQTAIEKELKKKISNGEQF